MRAAICDGPGEALRLEEVTLDGPGPGELRVRTKACAICHSDVAAAAGAWGWFPPSVFGHEVAGVVETVGPGVSDIAPGDHVIVTLVRSCGACAACHAGAPVRCSAPAQELAASPLRRARDGGRLRQGMDVGGFAEAMVVGRRQVAKAPRAMPFDQAALIACGVVTGVGAVTKTAEMPEDADVVVIGAGGVGLNAIQGARLRRARRIIALDLSEEKLTAALTFGATDLVDVRAGDPAEAVFAATSGRMASHVYVTVGARRAMEGAFKLVRAGGVVVWVGMPPTAEPMTIDAAEIAYREIRILGSRMGSTTVQEHIAEILADAAAGRLLLEPLISRRFAFDDVGEALSATARGEGLRNVVMFD